MSTYVYKYVHPDYPWLYVGKADTSFEDRIYRHSMEGKFLPFLDEVKIYYMELENKAQCRMVELYLIDKYKPHLNQMDKYEGISTFELNLPEWKIYTKEFVSTPNNASLIHWGRFPTDKHNLRKDNEILSENNRILKEQLKERDEEILNLRWKVIDKDDKILEIQKSHTDNIRFYCGLLDSKNDIIRGYMELLSKWQEKYEILSKNYNILKNKSKKSGSILKIFKLVS